jgi:hypothetical protein
MEQPNGGGYSQPNAAQRQAQRQAQAVRVLAMHTAQREVKDAIRREGKVKLCKVPARDITAMAKARLFEDAEYRAKLIADAKQVVEQWRAQGFFGKAVQHSQDLHKPGSAEPQALLLCESHDRNGATR